MSTADLTPRQQQIAELMAQGLKTGQIAERLGMSPGNVSMQKTLMKRRLGVESKAELAAMVGAPATMPPEIDVREDDYVSPRLKRTLFFHTTRGPARTKA